MLHICHRMVKCHWSCDPRWVKISGHLEQLGPSGSTSHFVNNRHSESKLIITLLYFATSVEFEQNMKINTCNFDAHRIISIWFIAILIWRGNPLNEVHIISHGDNWCFKWYQLFHFYPLTIWAIGYCPALRCPSFCLSIHPALVTTLQPTIYNGFCSYFTQSLTLVGTWTLLIIGVSVFIF